MPGFEPRARDTEMRWKACNLAGGENNRSRSQAGFGTWMTHLSPVKPCWSSAHRALGYLSYHTYWSCLRGNQGLGWRCCRGVLHLTKEPIRSDCVTPFLVFVSEKQQPTIRDGGTSYVSGASDEVAPDYIITWKCK